MNTRARAVHYLVCPAGIPNYGDELIAMTWLRHLSEVAPDADVVVDCQGPQAAAARMGGIHPRARFTNCLWQLCTRNWPRHAAGTSEAVTAAVRDPDRAGGLAGDLRELRRADKEVAAGDPAELHVLRANPEVADWVAHRGGTVAAAAGLVEQ